MGWKARIRMDLYPGERKWEGKQDKDGSIPRKSKMGRETRVRMDLYPGERKWVEKVMMRTDLYPGERKWEGKPG